MNNVTWYNTTGYEGEGGILYIPLHVQYPIMHHVIPSVHPLIPPFGMQRNLHGRQSSVRLLFVAMRDQVICRYLYFDGFLMVVYHCISGFCTHATYQNGLL